MLGNPWIHQFISVTRKIYAFFDANPSLDVKVAFLDISKSFDRVSHEGGLIYKIKCMGVKGDFPTLIKSFLFERQHRVVLNRQESEWLTIKCWCASGFNSWSIVFFMIYINNLSANLEFNAKLFADNNSIFLVVRDPINTSEKLNKELVLAFKWKNVFQSRSI